MSGQRLRRLVAGQSMAGYYEAVWDGRNAAGQVVAAGAYVGRLRVGAEQRTTRLMFLK